ncbi:serine/threonine-protein phosphatase, partial [bacterium]|nr:serine/threonine-protein phosphatase [bacterium]
IDTCSGITRLVRAGQTPTIIQTAQGDFTVLNKGNLPVGVDRNFEYNEQEICLGIGDRLLLYSDGISEARCFENKEQYGETRLYASMKSTAKLEFSAAISRIVQDLKDWLDPEKPKDDVSILGIEMRGRFCQI